LGRLEPIVELLGDGFTPLGSGVFSDGSYLRGTVPEGKSSTRLTDGRLFALAST